MPKYHNRIEWVLVSFLLKLLTHTKNTLVFFKAEIRNSIIWMLNNCVYKNPKQNEKSSSRDMCGYTKVCSQFGNPRTLKKKRYEKTPKMANQKLHN